MKKNFLFTVMAFFLGLSAASCSQDEIVSSNGQTGGETVSVAVNIPVNNPVTRAVPNIPDGYKLRCILQLVNSNDNSDIADGRHVMEVPAGSEKVTFTFNAPADPYKCLFWADYVKSEVTDVASADADNIYNTADLKAIGYTANAGDEMFKGDVADAFYACTLDAVTGNGALTSVNLVRPFTKITFKSTEESYTNYTKIVVTDLPAPTGFNVMTGTTIGYAGKGEYENNKIVSTELAIDESGNWFSAYLFTSKNASTLGEDNDIKFQLINAEGSATDELYFDGNNIPLTPNHEVSADVQPQKDGDTSIDVIFPGEMENPNKLAVGDYILKDGTWSREYSENAVAIVFALKNNNITDANNYEGKTAVAYAMAFNETERVTAYKEGDSKESNTFPTTGWTISTNADWTSDYSGLTYTNNIITALGDYTSDLLITQMNTFKSSNTFTNSDNLSTWYIPTARQQLDMFGILLGYTGDDNASIPAVTKNETFAAAYAKSGKGAYSNVRTEIILISSTITKETGSVLGFNVITPTAGSTNLADYSIKGGSLKETILGNAACIIRPVLTVFDGIQKAAQ